MIKSFAIYPALLDKVYTDKVEKIIKLAKKYCFDEVFTTIHLPEIELERQIEACEFICRIAHQYDLEVTVDIGGNYIDSILNDNKIWQRVRNLKIDFIRLDYGYSKVEVRDLYKKIKVKGFVLNASIYSKKEIGEYIEYIKFIDKDIKIRACHNFYLREMSGLDALYAKKQDEYFIEYNIPVYYCVPSYSHPRGPLFKGLCTLEKHRYQSIKYIVSDLVINHGAKAILMSDEWLEEREMNELLLTLNKLEEPLSKQQVINISFYDNATEFEKKIVLQEHKFRNDSSFDYLRSQSSRQMAEFAMPIKANNCTSKCLGDITIDNEGLKRYSGEMQVIGTKTIEDININVVAKLKDEFEMIKLWRFREGINYVFKE